MNLTVMGVGGVTPRRKKPSYEWIVDQGARANYRGLGKRLSKANRCLFRNGEYGDGLVHVLPNNETKLIRKAADLAPVIVDSLRMRVLKNNKVASELPNQNHLNGLLRSEVFLRNFAAVEQVVRRPVYRHDFSLTEPGYCSEDRLLYLGPPAEISDSLEAVHEFLDVMAFATNADRTNTVAGALTVLLNNHWPGEKPLILVTATKSHAGKGTVTDFVRGTLAKADILYESQDWPMQSQFQRQLAIDPQIGFICFDNVRLDSAGGRGKCIRSSFLESFITNPQIILASPGAGEPVKLENRFVVSLNTNEGALSPDLMNRALPIHLAPKGNIHERQSPIGNPKLEFLPQYRDKIEAELRGMIERWKEAGMPLDESVRHPMSRWAKTIGGILKVNDFYDFLGNYSTAKTSDDPIRDAIAILGAASPGRPRRPREWAESVVREGLAKTLFPANDRDTPRGRERGIGVILKRHLEETFVATTDTKRISMKLIGGNRRWEKGRNPHVRYEFRVLSEEDLPVDE